MDLLYIFLLGILRGGFGHLDFFLNVVFPVFRRTANLCILVQVLQEHELVAGVAESYRSSFLAYSHNVDSRLVETDGKRSIITVACHDDKGVIKLVMEQVQGIDHQRHVCGVLSRYIIELLLRLDGEALQFLLPVLQILFSPVSVGSLYHDTPFGGNLLYHRFQFGKLRIVGVDHHYYFFQIFHGISPDHKFFSAFLHLQYIISRRNCKSFWHFIIEYARISARARMPVSVF